MSTAIKKMRVSVYVFCLLVHTASAQSNFSASESGKPFIQQYTSERYQAHVQNWAAIQDARGVMYFGNSDGILEYDGVNWKLISTPKSTHVRSLDIDKQGRIFVGAYSDIGFIDYDSIGQPFFFSLSADVDTAYHDYLDVWKTFCKEEGVYFSSYKYLIRWAPSKDDQRKGSVKVWQSSTHFQFAFNIGEKLFIQERHKGLMELVNDSLRLIPGGEIFNESWIFAMMERDDGKILIVDRSHGLYTYDGSNFQKLETPAEKRILDSKVFHGIRLPGDNFALATNLDGILVLNNSGELIKSINTSNGLQNSSVTSLYLDEQLGIWATLSNGIDRIELISPLSIFQNFPGGSDAIQFFLRHRGKVYAAGGVGAYVLRTQRDGQTSNSYWEKLRGIDTQCWTFAPLGEKILIGTSNGMFYLDESDEVKLAYNGHTRSLYRSITDSSRVFVGMERRLQMIWLEGNKIQKKQLGEGINDEIFFINEDRRGYVWCSTVYNGIYRFQIDSSGNVLSSKHFGVDQGLPTLKNNTARLVNDRLLISTQDGVYNFDYKRDRFERDSLFGDIFKGTELVHILNDQRGRVWVHGNRDGERFVGYGVPTVKGFTWTMTPFNRTTKYSIYTIYPDRDDVMWFGGPKGVVRFDAKVDKEYSLPYKALIRKILIEEDSAIYAGSYRDNGGLEIAADYNALRFEFSASSYDEESSNQFSYHLEGFDKSWSGWTTEAKKDYTNLPDGKYKLRVKAKNIYGNISDEGVLIFSILPAWYDTWVAYVAYLLAFSFIAIGLVQWRFGRIRREKENLEQIVSERTKEVALQSDQLRAQAEKLKELDQLKSRFFANISHEFRTPLTLISGCVEDLIDGTDPKGDQYRLSVMQKNTNRLRQLIEQLLDLSKLESGKLQLRVSQQNPRHFLKSLTSSFSSWADQKDITMSIDLQQEDDLVYFDEDVLEKIINNLMSNAIKFTPMHGEVALSATWTTEILNVCVTDNGMGIPASALDKVFDRFYQVNDTSTRTQEGSGIGLALVKELVSLHHGSISAESSPGIKTKFTVQIPVHLRGYSDTEINIDRTHLSQRKLYDGGDAFVTDRHSEYISGTDERQLILVLEDNLDLGHYIRDHLSEFEVMLARNGKEGFEKAVRCVPDLIISDIMMPEMDGVEFCKKAKEDEITSHIPVILLTAKADIDSRLEGLQTGADDYITKPFNNRELRIRVQNLVTQRERLRSHFSKQIILKPKDIAITPPDEIFLNRIMAIIESHLSDSEFSVEDFQREIGMSRMQLHRKLKALTGHSAGEFIRIQRLIRASQMLSKTDANVSEVCYQTGFTSLSYFAKCFKKQFGTTPKEYASQRPRIV